MTTNPEPNPNEVSPEMRAAILREEAAKSEARPPTSEADRLLHGALRAQLTNIMNKPMGPDMLLELEQSARLMRELLAIGKMPTAFGVRRPNGFGGYNDTYPVMGGDSIYGASTGFGSGMNVETFGASLIRELVTKVGGKDKKKDDKPEPSMAELTEAIALAKGRGFDKLAERLENKLLQILDPSTSDDKDDDEGKPPAPPVAVPMHQHGPECGCLDFRPDHKIPTAERLEKLEALKTAGVITTAEYQAKKIEIEGPCGFPCGSPIGIGGTSWSCGRVKGHDGSHAKSETVLGPVITMEPENRSGIGMLGDTVLELSKIKDDLGLAEHTVRQATKGHRNETLLSEATRVAKLGWTRDRAGPVLLIAAMSIGLSEREANRTLDTAWTSAKNHNEPAVESTSGTKGA